MPHSTLPVAAKNIETLQTVIRTAFNQRRKTLKNSLKTIISEDKLQELAIDLGQRPEKLALADFVAISDVISAQGT